MTKKLFILSLFCLLSKIGFSQKVNVKDVSTFPKEKIFAAVNKNIFVSGEQILYKIFCFKNQKYNLSTLSKVGYIELINNNNQSVLIQKINLNKGEGSGNFFINTSLKTGGYKLIAYTQWMKNENDVFEEDVFIINPFANKLQQEDSLHKNIIIASDNKKASILKIKTNKNDYATREKVTVQYNQNLIKTVSVSVQKANNFNFIPKKRITSIFNNYQNKTSFKPNNHLPELRGELFTGTISTSKNKNLENIAIGVSFIGQNKISKIIKTNKKGKFFFTINQSYSADQVILEVLNEKGYKITLDNQTKSQKSFSNFKELYLTEPLRNYIKTQNKNIQIENAFAEAKKTEMASAKINTFVFENNTTKEHYLLDDYTRFKTIKEVAVEILQNVWISEKEDTYAFHVRDANLITNTNLKTLLIVDGYILNNHTKFMDFDALEIASIDVVREKYKYGAITYQGILNIVTKEKNYSPYTSSSFKLLKPLPSKKWFKPDYEKNSNHRIPDLRTQLYWDTHKKNESNLFSFYTSDIPGKYTITFQGILNDGTPVFEETSFTVQ
ncbi:hypothetical protein [Polaribacter sp. R77954]|uniref:hypothetical protein n=1 Tax=Polaribacter sp. R77954 TaxID=3093870 RepID=UPI0037CACCE4